METTPYPCVLQVLKWLMMNHPQSFIRASSVCKDWRALAVAQYTDRQPRGTLYLYRYRVYKYPPDGKRFLGGEETYAMHTHCVQRYLRRTGKLYYPWMARRWVSERHELVWVPDGTPPESWGSCIICAENIVIKISEDLKPVSIPNGYAV